MHCKNVTNPNSQHLYTTVKSVCSRPDPHDINEDCSKSVTDTGLMLYTPVPYAFTNLKLPPSSISSFACMRFARSSISILSFVCRSSFSHPLRPWKRSGTRLAFQMKEVRCVRLIHREVPRKEAPRMVRIPGKISHCQRIIAKTSG